MNSFEGNIRAAWLEGPEAKCSRVPDPVSFSWRVVLLGAPGVGKGTQATLLGQRLGACHLSTGDVFRAARNRPGNSQTPAMSGALDLMRQGHLVPDVIVWNVVQERVGCLRCQGGFLLDGFPRTLSQAESLQQLLAKEHLPLHAVLDFELPTEEIISRLSGRRTCAGCKAVFHIAARPPKRDGVCDSCAGRLYQREDDREDAIAVRLEDYKRNTEPLIQFYRRLGLLLPVQATGSPVDIFHRSLAALSAISPIESAQDGRGRPSLHR